jgi:hypothetical protein
MQFLAAQKAQIQPAKAQNPANGTKLIGSWAGGKAGN